MFIHGLFLFMTPTRLLLLATFFIIYTLFHKKKIIKISAIQIMFENLMRHLQKSSMVYICKTERIIKKVRKKLFE